MLEDINVFKINRLDERYRALLAEVLYNGTEKNDRTGTGTLSRFGMSIRHNMEDGFPILTTKKMPLNTISTELKWFLKGDTNIKYLVDNNCNIWNGDAYKNFLKHSVPHDRQETMQEFIEKIKIDDKFARKWGELGPIYGHQWRNWSEFELQDGRIIGNLSVDQIEDLLKKLKTNPDSRRLMVSAWNVGELDQMTLPPCHYGFQVYTRELVENERYGLLLKSGYDGKEMNTSNMMRVCDEKNIPQREISLMWNQRSADLFLGVPFNISSYGLLLLLLCEETGYKPGELIGNFGDIHLYKNHLEQAKEQISRSSYPLPKLEVFNVDILNGEFNWSHTEYKSHPTIKAPLSN